MWLKKKKKLESHLVLLASSSHIFSCLGHFLLVLVKYLEGDLLGPLPFGEVSLKSLKSWKIYFFRRTVLFSSPDVWHMSDTTHTDRQLFKQDVSYDIVATELQNVMWCINSR